MHSPWDVFIGYVFAGYMILSIASAPCLIGYFVYKVVNKLKARYETQKNDCISEILSKKLK